MFNKSLKKPSVRDIGNVPNAAYEQAKQEWFERMGEPVVEKNRWFVVALVIGLGLVASMTMNSMMLPLKTVEPYVINVNKDTGEVSASSVRAQQYKPAEPEKKYFLAKWIEQLITIDPGITEYNLRQAFALTRGKAIQEYTDFMNQTQPLRRLREEKTLTRQVRILSVAFVKDNIANVRFVAEERQAATTPVIKRYAAIIHFEVVPPVTEKDIIFNPVGLFITHFAITEEIT